MLTRTIPKTGEPITAVGLGTWSTFDVPATEVRPLIDVTRSFLAAGGKVIDSSPMYGRAESVVGDVLEELGQNTSAFLATKVWTTGKSEGIAQMERSFARLRRHTVDLMQIHNLVDWKVHLPTLKAWKREGRIRYVGITDYRLSAFDTLREIIERQDVDFVQLPYSVGVRAAEAELLPAAAAHGVAVLVMQPLEVGGLVDKVRGRPVPAWAAQELGVKAWAELFLKFVLAHPAVTCPIPATSVLGHLEENVRAAQGPLPDARQRQRIIDEVGAA
ncbi:aldo/keto reductase [Myxococcota bacterium]|nr:aldo/keto reductase [Myxococcota bacterium]